MSRRSRRAATGPTLFAAQEKKDAGNVRNDPGEPAFLPRDYQVEITSSTLGRFGEGVKSVLAVAATGTGKTVTAGWLARQWLSSESARLELPPRVLFLAHREELLLQAAKTFKDLLPRATIHIDQADRYASVVDKGMPSADIVCGSVATLSQANRLYRYSHQAFGLLIIDEAHHDVPKNRGYFVVKSHFPESRKFGITATPDRGDGRMLGQSYDEALEKTYSMSWGIEQGWLVPLYVECPVVDGFDVSGITLNKDGDLSAGQLAELMCNEKVLHGIVDPVVRLATKRNRWYDGRPRPTMVFAASVEHSHRMCEIFNRHHDEDGTGRAAHVDCERTTPEERREINRQFRSGDITYLCNFGVYGEGADFPEVKIVVLARKTTIRASVEQWIGRGTRPHPSIVSALNAATTPEERRKLIAESAKPGLMVIDPIANTGSHKLQTPLDVLGGWYDPAIVDAVDARVKKSGGGKDLNALLLAERKEREAAAAQKRKGVIIRTTFSVKRIDPFDVLDLHTDREPGWRKSKPPTPRMLDVLRKSRFPEEFLEKVTFGQAKQLIDEIIRRSTLGLCTFAQAKILKKYGHPTSLTFEAASEIIDALAMQGWPLPEGVTDGD